MFSKPNIISTLIATIWAYMGGYLLWDVIGGPLLKDHKGSAMNVEKFEPDMLLMLAACAITAFAFSTIYGKVTSKKHSVGSGISYGFLISLFGISYAMINYSMTNLMDASGALYDSVLNVIYYLIMGAIVGIVYRSFDSSSSD
jgi:hypothetical protein